MGYIVFHLRRRGSCGIPTSQLFLSCTFALFSLCEGTDGESEEGGGYVRDEEMTYFKIPKERIDEEVDDDKRRK